MKNFQKVNTYVVQVGAILAVELVEGQLVVVLPETHAGERGRLAHTRACVQKIADIYRALCVEEQDWHDITKGTNPSFLPPSTPLWRLQQ